MPFSLLCLSSSFHFAPFLLSLLSFHLPLFSAPRPTYHMWPRNAKHLLLLKWTLDFITSLVGRVLVRTASWCVCFSLEFGFVDVCTNGVSGKYIFQDGFRASGKEQSRNICLISLKRMQTLVYQMCTHTHMHTHTYFCLNKEKYSQHTSKWRMQEWKCRKTEDNRERGSNGWRGNRKDG